MRSDLTWVLILAVAGACSGGEETPKPDAASTARGIIEYWQEKIAVYKTITDPKTAEAAKPKLIALERRLTSIMLNAFGAAQDKQFELAVDKKVDELGFRKLEWDFTRESARIGKLPETDAIVLRIRKEAADTARAEGIAQLKKAGIDVEKLERERSGGKEQEAEPFAPVSTANILDGIKDDPGLLYPTRETVRRHVEAKLGDWVKLRNSGVEMQTLKRSGSEKYTVAAKNAEGLTIVKELNLQWEGKPQKRNTTDKFQSPFDIVTMRGPFLMVNTKYKTASGEETLRLGGKAYKCTWVETKENQQNGAISTMRTWICPEAPLYGALKQVRTMEMLGMGRTDYTEIEVIEFGTAAPDPAKTGAKK